MSIALEHSCVKTCFIVNNAADPVHFCHKRCNQPGEISAKCLSQRPRKHSHGKVLKALLILLQNALQTARPRCQPLPQVGLLYAALYIA